MSDDLELPKAVIKRIVKNKLSSLNDSSAENRKDYQVNKDALLAFSESTKVFIQYVACLANEHCKKAKRSTLQVDDVFKVLEEIEFGDYVEPLKTALAQKKEAQNQKKKRKAADADVEGGEESSKKQRAENAEENDIEMQGDEQDENNTKGVINEQETSSKKVHMEEEEQGEEDNEIQKQDKTLENLKIRDSDVVEEEQEQKNVPS
eukprot:TRINITY_DN5801_c0_g1_i1.p2 TRINITY_DN5801_c0_g1~~TRINITY_DN5801_c0_g1_i1.p2  ORF type:complete len:206 (+),score=53.81 TRINITY_DN5801_c0_g1_i1:44-661(+)